MCEIRETSISQHLTNDTAHKILTQLGFQTALRLQQEVN